MNISYFRKTNRSVKEVTDAFKKNIKEKGLIVTGETNLASGGVILQFLDVSRTEKIVDADHSVIGLVPTMVLIMKKDNATMIGLSNPQLLLGSAKRDAMERVVKEMDQMLRGVVNASAGVEDPKVEKIKLYSTATCPYCKMEKDYLEKHKVIFDLIMVDTDQKAAEEMVRKTGQMGVPATEVLFDDGDSEFIIGFDKGRLNELLNITA
jgi:glutaredoxin/uncharacterized protein (DUF302 family)